MIRRARGTLRAAAGLLARGAALTVTDRRWGPTLSAAALGFGIFAGVAIGPGTAGTLATGPQQLLALADPTPGPAPRAGTDRSSRPAAGAPGPPLAAGDGAASLQTFPAAPPLAAESSEPPSAAPAPAPATPPAAAEGDGTAAETTALRGTVVAVNPAAGSYALAIPDGELVPVHAARLPRPGTRLKVEAVRLANGTFAEQEREKRPGRAVAAGFRGVVTFVLADPLAPAYTLSGRGASLLVRVPLDPGGAPPLPAVGSQATARVAIEPASLLQRELRIEPGEPTSYLDLAGVYGGLDPESGRLLLSADGARAGERDLSLAVPPGIDATRLRPGDSYLATATVEPDGSLALAGIASDEGRKGADDPGAAQGDLRRAVSEAPRGRSGGAFPDRL